MKFLRWALALLFAAASSTQAAPVLWMGDGSGRLATVDVATGTATLVGTTSQVMTDIAFDPSGNLWGITFGQLFRINSTNAQITLVGTTGFTLNALVFGADGTLYAAGGNSLVRLNTSTGAGTLIGTGSYNSSGDLAFVGGQLYLSSATGGNDNLVRVNTTNGAGSLVGSLGISQVFGLATDNNVDLYGMAGQSVYRVSTTTGAASLLSSFAGQGFTAAFGTAFLTEAGAPNKVPEPGTLALLSLGMAGLVLVRPRRRARG